MPKIVNCECGQLVKGQTDEELIANVEAHVKEQHPELVGKLTREDILAMSEQA